MKERKEFTESVVISTNGGGVTGKVPGSPSTTIALDHEFPIGTFEYNTKRGTHDPGLPPRERKGGY